MKEWRKYLKFSLSRSEKKKGDWKKDPPKLGKYFSAFGITPVLGDDEYQGQAAWKLAACANRSTWKWIEPFKFVVCIGFQIFHNLSSFSQHQWHQHNIWLQNFRNSHFNLVWTICLHLWRLSILRLDNNSPLLFCKTHENQRKILKAKFIKLYVIWLISEKVNDIE